MLLLRVERPTFDAAPKSRNAKIVVNLALLCLSSGEALEHLNPKARAYEMFRV